jgi:hypothetical protein
MINPLKVKI